MKVLLFGTNYCDTREKSRVLEMWMQLALRHPGVKSHLLDVMIIDSQSPMLPYIPLPIRYYTFRDNIGHLGKTGKDGWGRAFCYGLFRAIAEGFDYVVHVECDSLLRPSIYEQLDWMQREGVTVASRPMNTQPRNRHHGPWIETGLMFFNVQWLQDTSFIQNYNWEKHKSYPAPEAVVRQLAGKDYRDLPTWETYRDDFKKLTEDNLSEQNIHWLTHAPLNVMERFYATT